MRLLVHICVLCVLWLSAPIVGQADRSVQGDRVRIQLKWQHQFQFAGYYAAFEKGFYAAEGLDVMLIEGGLEYDPMHKLLAGEVQYAVGDAGVLLSRAAGKPTAAFRRATIKGWQYAIKHQQEIIGLIKGKYDSQHKSIVHLSYEVKIIEPLMLSTVVPVGFSNKQRWQGIATVLESLDHPRMRLD